MSQHPSTIAAPSLLAGLLAGLLLAQAAAAQPRPVQAEPEPPPADAMISGVEVTAPKIVKREPYGVVERQISLSVRVPYSDLDMATPQGVAELDRRVADAADYACTQLIPMYPVGGHPDQYYCEKYAVSDAKPQVIKAREVR